MRVRTTIHCQQGRRVKNADQLGRLADKATDQAKSSPTTLPNRAARQGTNPKVAGNVRGAVDKSIKDQPIATLAVAAVAGFVLGALWKS